MISRKEERTEPIYSPFLSPLQPEAFSDPLMMPDELQQCLQALHFNTNDQPEYVNSTHTLVSGAAEREWPLVYGHNAIDSSIRVSRQHRGERPYEDEEPGSL